MIAEFPEDLPHFNKVLARKLLHQAQHLQLEQRGDELGSRGISHLFKQIVEMHGGIHRERFQSAPGGLAQLRGSTWPYFAAHSQKIRQEMKDAEAMRLEAEERAAAVDRRLASLDAEIAELRRQSKAEMETEAARMAQHTVQEIAKIRFHSETEIV